ncbi:MAG: ATP-binding protein [Saprospiraceae bacterium]|nr:ATP-binding protein [Candidatus Vicinibacter affinis]
MNTTQSRKLFLWTSAGAIASLLIVFPLIISLLKFDAINHVKPFSEVIISSYKSLLLEIHFDKLIMLIFFLLTGGFIGYLLYHLITAPGKKKNSLSLTKLLEKGECETVEFKSSFRWDYNQNKTNKDLEFAVLKTIAAFMNTRSGFLLIGVADDASIIGLENDYQSLKKKNRDGFEQYLMNLVSLNIGADCCKNIHVTFFERSEKDICVIEVSHIKIPVFLKHQQHTYFYARTGNHTRELDVQEALKYIKTHKLEIR